MYTTTFSLPSRSSGAGFWDNDDELTSSRSWRISEDVCALADDERHFGHAIRTEQWNAYDATHLNEASGGFKHLGAFEDLAAAMHAVERSVERRRETRTMHAGAGMAWYHTF